MSVTRAALAERRIALAIVPAPQSAVLSSAERVLARAEQLAVCGDEALLAVAGALLAAVDAALRDVGLFVAVDAELAAAVVR